MASKGSSAGSPGSGGYGPGGSRTAASPSLHSASFAPLSTGGFKGATALFLETANGHAAHRLGTRAPTGLRPRKGPSYVGDLRRAGGSPSLTAHGLLVHQASQRPQRQFAFDVSWGSAAKSSGTGGYGPGGFRTAAGPSLRSASFTPLSAGGFKGATARLLETANGLAAHRLEARAFTGPRRAGDVTGVTAHGLRNTRGLSPPAALRPLGRRGSQPGRRGVPAALWGPGHHGSPKPAATHLAKHVPVSPRRGHSAGLGASCVRRCPGAPTARRRPSTARPSTCARRPPWGSPGLSPRHARAQVRVLLPLSGAYV